MYQRHSKDREPAFPVFMGLSVHSKTRKKEIVNTLFEHGLSISYDRVLEISTQLVEAVVKIYVDIRLVCPPQLRLGVFTVSAVDNCEYNRSASTAKTSFHGTSISLSQSESSVEPQNDLVLNRNVNKIPDLTESYTNVKPAYFPKKLIPPENELTEIREPSKFHLEKEYTWLEMVHLTKEFTDSVQVTWSAHNAAQIREQSFAISMSALMSLLRDQAHEMPTTKHEQKCAGHALCFCLKGKGTTQQLSEQSQ